MSSIKSTKAYIHAYPLPDVADIVQEVGKARFISTSDATKGYYQTAVQESDCWLTAFICEFGLFVFTRTPFGMRSSGSTFVRAMQQVLQPVRKFTASILLMICRRILELGIIILIMSNNS